jgi:uncharacterized membrane protein
MGMNFDISAEVPDAEAEMHAFARLGPFVADLLSAAALCICILAFAIADLGSWAWFLDRGNVYVPKEFFGTLPEALRNTSSSHSSVGKLLPETGGVLLSLLILAGVFACHFRRFLLLLLVAALLVFPWSAFGISLPMAKPLGVILALSGIVLRYFNTIKAQVIISGLAVIIGGPLLVAILIFSAMFGASSKVEKYTYHKIPVANLYGESGQKILATVEATRSNDIQLIGMRSLVLAQIYGVQEAWEEADKNAALARRNGIVRNATENAILQATSSGGIAHFVPIIGKILGPLLLLVGIGLYILYASTLDRIGRLVDLKASAAKARQENHLVTKASGSLAAQDANSFVELWSQYATQLAFATALVFLGAITTTALYIILSPINISSGAAFSDILVGSKTLALLKNQGVLEASSSVSFGWLAHLAHIFWAAPLFLLALFLWGREHWWRLLIAVFCLAVFVIQFTNGFGEKPYEDRKLKVVGAQTFTAETVAALQDVGKLVPPRKDNRISSSAGSGAKLRHRSDIPFVLAQLAYLNGNAVATIAWLNRAPLISLQDSHARDRASIMHRWGTAQGLKPDKLRSAVRHARRAKRQARRATPFGWAALLLSVLSLLGGTAFWYVHKRSTSLSSMAQASNELRNETRVDAHLNHSQNVNQGPATFGRRLSQATTPTRQSYRKHEDISIMNTQTSALSKLDIQNPFMKLKISYFCLMVAPFVGITAFVALVLALLIKTDDRVLKTHIKFVLNTLWIWFATSVISFLLWPTSLAWIVILAATIVVIVRAAKGYRQLRSNNRAPVTIV